MLKSIGALIVSKLIDYLGSLVYQLTLAWWKISGDTKTAKKNAEKLLDELNKEVPDDKAIEDRSERLLNGD